MGLLINFLLLFGLFRLIFGVVIWAFFFFGNKFWLFFGFRGLKKLWGSKVLFQWAQILNKP